MKAFSGIISKKRIILIIIIGILLIIVLIFNSKYSDKNKYKKLEKDFTELVKSYYERDIKNKIIGLLNHKVELKLIRATGFDTSKIIDPKTKQKCKEESYALVEVINEDGEYTIENYLSCGTYETKGAE